MLGSTDPELRREVERLLDQDSEGQILDAPAADSIGKSTQTHLPPMPSANWSGTEISHYRIIEKLGARGVGVVYKALDKKLGRLVALKFLPPQMRDASGLSERLAREAHAGLGAGSSQYRGDIRH